jgi:ribosomal protein L37AE/L43A
MNRPIDALIRERIGNAVIPPPVKGVRWQRFACPFCGKARAAINYGAGWFQCYHADCGITISASGDYSAVTRFRPQIAQAERNIQYSKKWGKWFKRNDNELSQQACLLAQRGPSRS